MADKEEELKERIGEVQTDTAEQMVGAAIAAEEECKGVGTKAPHRETTHLGMTRGGSAAAPPPVIPRSLRAIDQQDLVIMIESIPPIGPNLVQTPASSRGCSLH